MPESAATMPKAQSHLHASRHGKAQASRQGKLRIRSRLHAKSDVA